MNTNSVTDHRGEPRHSRASCAGLAIALLTASGLLSSCSSSADPRNESYELLRSVPLPVNDVVVSSLGELDLEEGQVLKQQTYTVSPSGEFTLDRLIESEVGSVGASFAALSPSHAKRLEMEPFSGVYVCSLRNKGPLSRAGVRTRDAIVSVEGDRVSSQDQLVHLIESQKPGTSLAIEYNHDGEISATTVEVEKESRIESIRPLRQSLEVLDDRTRSGLKLVELPPDIYSILRGQATDSGGLLILEILPGGPAFFSDLRVRDFVTHVGERPVTTHEEYRAALGDYEPDDAVAFTARRDGHPVETAVTIDDDATSSSGFNLLSLVKYRNKPEERRFSMVWEILFHSAKSYSVVKSDNVGQHTSSTSWGAFLDLLRYRRSPSKTEFDFLWILPITFRNSEESS